MDSNTTKVNQHSGKIPVLTKITYGIGSIAFGVKNNGFDYFLLLFYSQVLHVNSSLVGLALAIALVFDAVSDPIVGYFSDNLHSRWGRRHPFMYFAAIPVSITYFLLWNPPQWDENALFIYLIVMSVLIRTCITLYETPSSALAPELTEDYNERTSLISYRYFFGWMGGNAMSILMFGWLLVATVDFPDGRFNPDAYATYGILSSCMIFFAIMVSALGTHKYIPHLKAPPPKKKVTLKRIFVEIFQSLADRSAIALILASVFGAIATGVAAALTFLMLTYFWELTTEQIFYWTALVIVSAMIGMAIAPYTSKLLNKKKGTILLGLLAFSIAPFPVLARLLGIFPENGDPLLLPLLIVINTIDIGLIIGMQILFASMIADLVEQSEIRTKRRSEGVFFAAITLSRKTVQGLGVLVAGIILSVVSFPQDARPGEIPETVLEQLGLYYVISLYFLWGAMLACIALYRIDQAKHEENLKELNRL